MASKTTIAWATRSWNPTVGCSRVSEGCRHCYAERWAARFDGTHPAYEGVTKLGGAWSGRVNLASEKTLYEPLRRRKPERYFVNSMSDLFHQTIPEHWVDRVFAIMANAPRHRFLVLTKRPGRMCNYASDLNVRAHEVAHAVVCEGPEGPDWNTDLVRSAFERGPLPNVALGVSVEDQRTADARIPVLRETPAALRFLSVEPMLQRIDLGDISGIDWIIVGGESGPGARPFFLEWAKEIVQRCIECRVPVFVKQLGARPVHFEMRVVLEDRKGEDPEEWPLAGLRVRQIPKGMRLPGEPADLCRPEGAS